MKRIDRIYNYIIENSKYIVENGIESKIGFTSVEISESLNILRNNVSMELNELLRQDRIIKIKSRPVLYIDRNTIERIFKCDLPKGPLEFKNINEILKVNNTVKNRNPFDDLIGSGTSLKSQVEQAKAAILYPPNGLHTLIVGQTGVGKTLFAKLMYSYAKYSNRLEENAPFIIFNCADYYNNPQLLISYIFGHAKGAFTGADSEKPGIVEKADGGILFLDEIHRLPPEGQEMLFYFMDTGTFNKLGETERNRTSNVLIIGATTEDPNSSLLKTFIRRIPIVISIPSFESRTVQEKIELTKFLLSNEAHRVNKPIKIDAEVVKALIGSTTYGNIGQMKSNIQLVCANGFLNSLNNPDFIEINLKILPSDIKKGLLYLSGKRKEITEISKYIDSQVIITPDGSKILLDGEDPYELPFNLYKIIEDKTAVLKDGGADDDYINNFITTDINIHIKSFYDKLKNGGNERDKLKKIVNENIIEFVENIKVLVENKLNKKLNERFIYALSLHISAFLNRMDNKETLTNIENIDVIIQDKRTEFNIALEITDRLEKIFKVDVPKIEVRYLTLLLSSIQEEKTNEHVSIIVAAHGSSTASSMVNFIKQLLGDCDVEAIDMPLEVNPTETLKQIIDKTKEIDMGKGVLLLVDMGSLSNFESIITEKTHIKVKTIDMVSTPLLLEAVRKATIIDMSLENLYNSLIKFKGYSEKKQETNFSENKTDAIITICSTGDGTAKKLKELVQNIIYSSTKVNVEVIPLGIINLKDAIKEINNNYNIIAAVGVLDPKIDVPFISLETLIGGNGEKFLTKIVQKDEVKIQSENKNVVVKKLCEDSLNQFLTYLNPLKIICVLIEFNTVLENKLNKKFNNSMSIRTIVHVGCALERMVINNGLTYTGDIKSINSQYIKAVKEAANIFKKALNINLSDDEIYFISEMLK